MQPPFCVCFYKSGAYYNPFQTVIKDSEGRRRFFVSTAYSSDPGFLNWNGNGYVHWETMVFPCELWGDPSYDDECAVLRCDSYEEALQNHLTMVAEFSADL